jgi:hypothetical protein
MNKEKDVEEALSRLIECARCSDDEKALETINQALTSNVSEEIYLRRLKNIEDIINKNMPSETSTSQATEEYLMIPIQDFYDISSLCITTPQSLEELKQEIIDELTPFYDKYYKNHNFNKEGKIVFDKHSIVWRTTTKVEGPTNWLIYSLYNMSEDLWKNRVCPQLTNKQILKCATYFMRLEDE